MVVATLREVDPKTQTRRAMKIAVPDGVTDFCSYYHPDPGYWLYGWDDSAKCLLEWCAKSPYGGPRDRLYVRENGWQRPERTAKMMREGADTWAPYYFDADGLTEQDVADFKAWGFKRRPSIHMPRWASRILLEVVSIRVERLRDISEADCIAEGITRLGDDGFGLPDGRHYHAADPRISYLSLWEAINGDGSVEANPWVWVVEFKRINHV